MKVRWADHACEAEGGMVLELAALFPACESRGKVWSCVSEHTTQAGAELVEGAVDVESIRLWLRA